MCVILAEIVADRQKISYTRATVMESLNSNEQCPFETKQRLAALWEGVIDAEENFQVKTRLEQLRPAVVETASALYRSAATDDEETRIFQITEKLKEDYGEVQARDILQNARVVVRVYKSR